MNSVKIIQLTFLVLLSGLNFLSAMELTVEPTKENIEIWKQDLANLSNSENWDKDGLPKEEWIHRAVQDAIKLIEEKKKEPNDLLKELEDKSREYYKRHHRFPPLKTIQDIKEYFKGNIDAALKKKSELQRVAEKRQKKEKKRAQKQQWVEEREQQRQQKLKDEALQLLSEQHKNETVWEKYLANLSKEENWYEGAEIKQKRMSRIVRSGGESNVPTQEWMEKAAEFAAKLIIKDKATTSNMVVRALDRALEDHYPKISHKTFIETIELVKDNFYRLLEQQLDKKRQQQQKEEEQRKQEIQQQKWLEEEKQFEQQQHMYSQTIEKQAKHKLLKSLLGTVSNGWEKAPSEDWQNSIIQTAIVLIEETNTPEKRSEICDAINNAIDGYSKTLWFPDEQAIAAAKNNICKQIYSSIPGFEQFAQYFKRVAESPVREDNGPDKDWIYDIEENYYNLNSKTLKDIAHAAAVLIKDKKVPTSVIENMMSSDLVEARRDKYPQFRSPDQLGIMKAIKAEQQEQEKAEQERIEKERIEKEKAEKERIEREKAEKEEAELAAKEKEAKEQAEKQEQEKAEQVEKEKVEAVEKQKIEAENLAKIKQAAEKRQEEKQEQEIRQRQEEQKKQQEQHKEIQQAIKRKVASYYKKPNIKKPYIKKPYSPESEEEPIEQVQEEKQQPGIIERFWRFLGYSYEQLPEQKEKRQPGIIERFWRFFGYSYE